ncbi:CHAT domain-containing protein [Dactylosporangium sp. NBC_01737]|uniref:CHAT domain-containing protein n=1 Tax=Dactylosporangium sp. NBC_01737 TaxID=2975959 RepID=UPI002E167B52|nr:CHAT domain-containing protein [Dactylosporangium sp. NBC_01737]
MTRHDIDAHDEFDASHAHHDPGPRCVGRTRTLKLHLRAAATGFEVHAWGDSLPENTAERHVGHLYAGPQEIRRLVRQLHRDWATYLIDVEDPDGHRSYTFADRFDLSEITDQRQVDAMWRRLAEAGHELFQALFAGDRALRALGERVARVLRGSTQVITVLSDDVVVPWAMLYVPKRIWAPLPADFEVELDAFIGHRHHIEQVLTLPSVPGTEIQVSDGMSAGAYYDDRLDRIRDNGRPAPAIVSPIVKILTQYGTVHERTSRDDLRDRLRTDGAHDHLLYFCCHCADAEVLMLGRDAADGVTPENLQGWLRKGFTRSPLVVVNACRAGVTTSNSNGQLGTALLGRGAGCLIGPVVNVPTVFAGEFARRLFEMILPNHSDLRFGEAVRTVARDFAHDHRNPLGLAYMVYHGIDAHFCRWEA